MFVVAFTVAFVVCVVGVDGDSMAPSIIGYNMISPYTLPVIFATKFAIPPVPLATDELTVFIRVPLANAVPLVALPAAVLLVTAALPDCEVDPIVLLIILVVMALVVPVLLTAFVVPVDVGDWVIVLIGFTVGLAVPVGLVVGVVLAVGVVVDVEGPGVVVGPVGAVGPGVVIGPYCPVTALYCH